MEEFDTQKYIDYRKEKDGSFRFSKNSPIPVSERPGFMGLKYFDPIPYFDIMAVFHAVDGVKDASWGKIIGTAKFAINDKELELTLYRYGGLNAPFKDLLSGKETYGMGRYLNVNIEEGQELKNGDQINLDFNLSFNPYCAYNDRFTCALVPKGNFLDIEIRAGEKTYKDGHSS